MTEPGEHRNLMALFTRRPELFQIMLQIAVSTAERDWAMANVGTIKERDAIIELRDLGLIEILQSDVSLDVSSGRLKRGEFVCKATSAGMASVVTDE